MIRTWVTKCAISIIPYVRLLSRKGHFKIETPRASSRLLGKMRCVSRDEEALRQPHIGELSRLISDGFNASTRLFHTRHSSAMRSSRPMTRLQDYLYTLQSYDQRVFIVSPCPLQDVGP